MPKIIGAFDYSGVDYLDKRKKWNSLAELKAQNTILFPNGFECWCEKEKSWYQLNTTDPSNISSYKWNIRVSSGGTSDGSCSIIVDDVETTDYQFKVNLNEVETAYNDVSSAILQQIQSMFSTLNAKIEAQDAKIRQLELEIEDLKTNGGYKPSKPTNVLVDYNGDILVDYDGNAIGNYADIPIVTPTNNIIDYNGNILADYDGNTIGNYNSTPITITDTLVDYNGNNIVDFKGNSLGDYASTSTSDGGITDYNGNTLVDYERNIIEDYESTKIIHLSDYIGNNLVDYKEDSIVDYSTVG